MNATPSKSTKTPLKKARTFCSSMILLVTGGTAKANIELVEKLGGKVVGLGFLIELDYLDGRKTLGNKH